MNRAYRWQFHFNAVHNMTPENEEEKHPHSFLVILYIEMKQVDLSEQKNCEEELIQYLKQYNGQYLNEMEKFHNMIPTIEVICEILFREIEPIAAAYGMNLIQVEVGDSPVVMYALGKKLLLGGIYSTVSDKRFREYSQQLDR